MIKLIIRKSDNKYLQSAENDTWVDNIKDAFEMTYRECENSKLILLNTYSIDDIKEFVNLRKNKPITLEEAEEIKNLLKNK